jgi:hypothetical protein
MPVGISIGPPVVTINGASRYCDVAHAEDAPPSAVSFPVNTTPEHKRYIDGRSGSSGIRNWR